MPTFSNVGSSTLNDKAKFNQDAKKTLDYDLEASEKKPENENYEKKEFKNKKIEGDKNFVQLNTNEDLYLKKLKEKGFDKEKIDENKGDEKKRYFNNDKQRHHEKREFKKYNTNNNEHKPPKEIEYDSDGFEIVGSEKKQKKPSFTNRPYKNKENKETAEDIWNKAMNEGNANEENNNNDKKEGNENENNEEKKERSQRKESDRPNRSFREQKDHHYKNDRRGTGKRGGHEKSTKWTNDNAEEEEKKEKTVVVVKTTEAKQEAVIIAKDLKAIFGKKK